MSNKDLKKLALRQENAYKTMINDRLKRKLIWRLNRKMRALAGVKKLVGKLRSEIDGKQENY